MPLKLQLLTTKGTEWVGWCKHRLHILSAMRKPGRLLKQTYSLPKGIMAQIVSSDICDIIRIWGGGLTGIICHPRSQNQVDSYVIPAASPSQEALSIIAIVGGWHTDKDGNFVELTSNFDYPLVDSDNASFLFSGDTSIKTGDFLGAEGNYGNIYWHNNDIANLSIISFKGIPTRHFMLTQQESVTGADFAINGQGVCIYKDGLLLTYTRKDQNGNHEVVNGAAEIGGDIICCTPSGVSTFLDNKWVDIPIIGWLASGAWFFDSTGKKTINSEGTRILSFQKADNGSVSGVQINNYVPATSYYLYLTSIAETGYSAVEYKSDKILQDSCFELKANGDIAQLSVVASLAAKSEYKNSASKSFADYAIYDNGAKYIVILTGPDNNGIICAGLANYDGSPASPPPGLACGPFTYSFSGAAQIGTSSCAIIPNAGCYPTDETMTVGVTITGPGVSASGSKTFTVAAKAGHWSTPGICSVYYITGALNITGQTECYDGGTPVGITLGVCSGTQTDTGPTLCTTLSGYSPGGFGANDGGHVQSLGTYTQYVKLDAQTVVGASPPCDCSYSTGASWANIVSEVDNTITLYYGLQPTGPCAGSVVPLYGTYCDTVDWSGQGHAITHTSKSGYNTQAGTVIYTWICT